MLTRKQNQPKLIFIAEDNAVYAKSIQLFLKNKFPQIEFIIYPVGELVIDNLDKKPDLVIVDYFLNSKYSDAADGKSIVKEIKMKDPNIHVIVLSAQQDIEVAIDIKDLGCQYFVKNDESLKKIVHYIMSLTKR